MTAFYERVTLPDWEGPIQVSAQGMTADGMALGTASSNVTVEKGTAMAVYLALTAPSTETPDAGAAADGAGTDAGTAATDTGAD
jgi:hypothetical protein